ncbi:hypothetical protein ACFQBQ_01230 [Granulicella cerasi]|uniref:Uncharacterized protein n=1 Tax=Granulicella cerasi TaxID=741063 RepID=A0ABW1Z477_9BACT|nr:hypothetical protein [Granulicella cerasi]
MLLDDLLTVKDDMVAFIAGHGLRTMTAFVPEELAAVLFEDDDPESWKDFVEHAKSANVPFVTMSEVVLEPEDVATLLEQVRDQHYPDHEAHELEEAQSLTQHVGKIGYLQLGFSAGGVVYLYEAATPWYDQFQELLDSVSGLSNLMIDDHDDDSL